MQESEFDGEEKKEIWIFAGYSGRVLRRAASSYRLLSWGEEFNFWQKQLFAGATSRRPGELCRRDSRLSRLSSHACNVLCTGICEDNHHSLLIT